MIIELALVAAPLILNPLTAAMAATTMAGAAAASVAHHITQRRSSAVRLATRMDIRARSISNGLADLQLDSHSFTMVRGLLQSVLQEISTRRYRGLCQADLARQLEDWRHRVRGVIDHIRETKGTPEPWPINIVNDMVAIAEDLEQLVTLARNGYLSPFFTL